MRYVEGTMLDLRANNKYETDLYWCHQLFFAGWVPGQGHIEELPSETTNTCIGPRRANEANPAITAV